MIEGFKIYMFTRQPMCQKRKEKRKENRKKKKKKTQEVHVHKLFNLQYCGNELIMQFGDKERRYRGKGEGVGQGVDLKKQKAATALWLSISCQ